MPLLPARELRKTSPNKTLPESSARYEKNGAKSSMGAKLKTGEILLRLLPFFEVPLNDRGADAEMSK